MTVVVTYKAPPDMNGTERAYQTILEARKRNGEVREYHYQLVTVRLADAVRYTPDFTVILADGRLELHEVKGGFVRDDARVKLQVAARSTPFAYVLAQYKAKRWTIEAVTP